jgi:hypothetical protein
MRTLMPVLAVVFAMSTLGMAGCPNPGPNPPGPGDASADGTVSTMDSAPTPTPTVDAAPPPPVVDAAPPPPGDPCGLACSQMNDMGCPQAADCTKVLGLAQANRIIRNPKTGQVLTCADLVAAKTPADVKANGWNCNAPAKH